MSLRRNRIKNQKKPANEKKWLADLPPKSGRSTWQPLFFEPNAGNAPHFADQSAQRIGEKFAWPNFWAIGFIFLRHCLVFRFFFEDDLSYLNSSGKCLKGSAIPKGFTNKFIIYCVTSWIIGRDFQWKKKRFRPHLFGSFYEGAFWCFRSHLSNTLSGWQLQLSAGRRASRASAKTVEDNKHQQTKKQQNWEISVARPPWLRSLLCPTHYIFCWY